MTEYLPTWTMLGLDMLMLLYSNWVLSLNQTSKRFRYGLLTTLAIWMMALHLLLSNRLLFPENISGPVFLLIVIMAVAFVGLLLLRPLSLRKIWYALTQQQLLLFQGIRVFFGAGFLMMAATGSLPVLFGVLDGWTHMIAGFLGLVAAYTLSADQQGERRVWFANIFGLLDILIVASTLSLILLPQITPHHAMMYAVFLPAPLWLWFHIISLHKLLLTKQHVDESGTIVQNGTT